LKPNIPWTSKLSYPQVVAPLFRHSSFHTCVSTKSFVGFGSRPIIVACKRKMLLDKRIHIKQQFKKLNVIKKNNCTIYFVCEKNKMDLSVYMVILSSYIVIIPNSLDYGMMSMLTICVTQQFKTKKKKHSIWLYYIPSFSLRPFPYVRKCHPTTGAS